MTEEQRKELDALAHRFQYKKVVAYAERLELEARIDQHAKDCALCYYHPSYGCHFTEGCDRQQELRAQLKGEG